MFSRLQGHSVCGWVKEGKREPCMQLLQKQHLICLSCSFRIFFLLIYSWRKKTEQITPFGLYHRSAFWAGFTQDQITAKWNSWNNCCSHQVDPPQTWNSITISIRLTFIHMLLSGLAKGQVVNVSDPDWSGFCEIFFMLWAVQSNTL